MSHQFSERSVAFQGPKTATLSMWLLLVFVFGIASCSAERPYVWVKDLKFASAAPKNEYVIQPGDLVRVQVYNDERVSTSARVRSDGHISVMFVGDVQAEGKTAQGLARLLEKRLAKFLNTPSVTVGLEEVRPITVTVLGEVRTPGVYGLPQRSGVLEALGTAGGFTEFADQDRIFVVRREPPVRVRIRYHSLVTNEPRATAFLLANGDLVEVE